MDKEFLNMIAGTKNKMIHGNICGDVDIIEEWIKWLEYVPREQQIKIDEMFYKKVSELSLDELDYYREYLSQMRMAKLFRGYGVEEMDPEKYKEVYKYMHKNIEKIMLSKLNKTELKYAKEKITEYKEGNKDELSRHVKTLAENFDKLSMVDSYILHILSKVDVSRSLAELDRNISIKIEENHKMLALSYKYAQDDFV